MASKKVKTLLKFRDVSSKKGLMFFEKGLDFFERLLKRAIKTFDNLNLDA